LKKLEGIGQVEDFKSLLQEFTQETYKTRPDYLLIGDRGPAHDKTFKVALQIQGRIVAEGEGKSKKEAEQKAAREAFCCLTSDRVDL
jgi:ribonuclease III